MKTLYLDCSMGAAGDMLSAALWELLPVEKRAPFIEKMNSLGLPGVTVSAVKSVKCGITGTHFEVTVDGETEQSCDVHACHVHDHDHHHDHDGHHHDHHHDHEHHHEGHHHDGHGHHHHYGMADISAWIEKLDLPAVVRENIYSVYSLIAEAESTVHGVPVDMIHFHEVGSADALADVTAVCLLLDILAPESIIASPVHVGSGHVHCAHGILPVPAPATAHILRGIPCYGGNIEGELCTPTGAALLKHFAGTFGEMPALITDSIGYGMGTKDFPVANCLRALLGTTGAHAGVICELSCNVDDMTGEDISYAAERFFKAGAVEVYTVPIGMKKSRPGHMICVMVPVAKRDEMVRLMLAHTSTLGVRENISRRYTLSRSVEIRDTVWGKMRVKKSEGYGVSREKYEYEDIALAADENGVPIEKIKSRL